MSNYININALSWNRFLTRALEITPELMGKSHVFKYSQHNVTITLPSGDLAELVKAKIPHLDYENRIAVISWREDGGTKKIPVSLAVESVDVTIEIPQPIHLREEMLSRSPNAYDLLNDFEKKHLDELGSTYSYIAEDSFAHWLRVLRWKSRNGSIAQPLVRNYHSGWGTYLMDNSQKRHFWMFHPNLTVMLNEPISVQAWQLAEEALVAGEEAPLYLDTFFDGIEHKKRGDFQRSVVDFAVTCEVFMRTKVMNGIPTDLIGSMKDYIDEANIRVVLTKFFPRLLSTSGEHEFKRILSKLHQLFDKRNEILHSGALSGLSEQHLQQFQEAAELLIYFDDHPDYWN